MDSQLLEMLADPDSGSALELQDAVWLHGRVQTGKLRSSDGEDYEIRDGIPRFAGSHDEDQDQTASSFGFKWAQLTSYESTAMAERGRSWLLERYGFSDAGEMRRFFEAHARTMDLGCGGGFSSSLWMDDGWSGGSMWVGVDISSAIDVARSRLGRFPGTHFVQADALRLPFAAGTFDAVFSEGVLHHTPSTRDALASAARLLAPGGEFLFYVYRRKGAVREFTDDHVRALVSDLEPEQAWEALKPLTALGQALAASRATVRVEQDVPLLGISAGTHDVQRFVYWNFAKLFWNETLSFDENHHINFDWYHPRYAHRQTEEDVRSWCAENDLAINRFNTQESGFTVRANKR